MNLKESNEGYMRGFEGRKGTGEMLQLYYAQKNRISTKEMKTWI